MAYTLKRAISGLTDEDIKRIYDQNPNMTLRELSNLTGYAIPFLKKLNSLLHIDDSVEVCTLCIMAGIETLLVDWGQENNNTTARFLPKI